MTDKPMSSKDVGLFLIGHRENDLKVDVGTGLVPVADVSYRPQDDTLIIELVEGEDLKVANAGRVDLSILGRFAIVVYAFDGGVCLGLDCRRCDYVLEVPDPTDLANLAHLAEDHAETCQ